MAKQVEKVEEKWRQVRAQAYIEEERRRVKAQQRQLSNNRHRQIAPDCRRLPQIAYIMVQVENGGKLQWNLVDLGGLT